MTHAPALLRSPLPCTPTFQTLPALLADAASRQGDALFARFMDGGAQDVTLSFAGAWQGARRVARALGTQDLKAGDPVIVLLPTGPEFPWAFFGVQLVGAVPVPYPAPFLARGDEREVYLEGLAKVVDHCQAKALITLQGLCEFVAPLTERCESLAAILASERLDEAGNNDAEVLDRAHPDGLALLQYTSGPAHAPHGVMLSQRGVLANVYGIGVALGLGPQDVGLSWLPLFQDMGLVGALLVSLYWRYPTHYMRPESFLLRPQLWLQAISELGVTLSAAPSFAYRMCVRRIRDKQMEGMDLSRWRVALNGAEPIDPEAAEAFVDKFAAAGFRKDAMRPAYGLAENSLAVTIARREAPWRVEDSNSIALTTHAPALEPPTGRFVSIGVPLPGQAVAIVDADGQQLAEGCVGSIVIDSPSAMLGYLRDEAKNAAALQGGWLHTGDLGFIADGELFIVGRSKDLIIKRGRNTYPEDLEDVAAQILGIETESLVAFAVPNAEAGTEDLVLLIESEVGAQDSRERTKTLDTALLAHLGIRSDVCVWVGSGTLVRDLDGRKLRQQTRSAYLRGVQAAKDVETASEP
ncbi:MAG: hypothetical protein CO108_14675 [Deltaproteobacteria bacterium CG_4_9_14_3_um_filter_63_12]|nr:MAG: hypothetical protein CO108_14675 [Deltaproteobacteria bacterium CG_4_9_14_3_um_filter_63_12]